MSETFNKKELYNSINNHLASIDDSLKTLAWVQYATLSLNEENNDSLKTLAWVQSATLSMNRENMKKLNDTTTKMMSSFSALSQNDDNSSDDTNDVPEDVLVYSNDIKRERNGDDD